MRILGWLPLVTLMAGTALSAAGCGGAPVGEELARLNYEGESYVLVEYCDKLAVFHTDGAPVNSRDQASRLLHSYAWTQQLERERQGELSRVAARVEDIDSKISEVRTAANATVGIFEQLEDLEANIPLLGNVSAWDVVGEVYPGLSGARSSARSLSRSLNDFGNDAETLAAAARQLDNAQVSSGIDSREMDQAARNGASAASGLAKTAAAVENSVSDARDGVSDLVSALRDAADTPLIGGAIGGMASTAGRFESRLDGLELDLADLGGDLQDAASAFEGTLNDVTENHEKLVDRWLQEPHDSQWPPLDPERRPAGIAAPEPTREPRATAPNFTGSATATPTAVAPSTSRPPSELESYFASISAGGYHTCGVKRDGSVACWGPNGFGQSTPPAGEFASISAGDAHTCGVRPNGTVDCRGNNFHGQSTPPAEEFASVSAGRDHTCGLRTDGTVDCWGEDQEGRATPPAEEFASISAGGYHTCGVKRDGSVACWGRDDEGQATPPDREFSSVSAGLSHNCGVRRDGAVACWGRDDEGQATPPGGEFSSVSAGLSHNCGVRTDGTVACWGGNSYGQATPPVGEFSSVSAGFIHACGVRTDGALVCWGAT